MTNTMPTFAVRKTVNGEIVGYVRAVAAEQALVRAYNAHGRCVVEQMPGARIANVDRNGAGICDAHLGIPTTHGRKRYPTPGFDARRAALIAAHKAGA